MGSADGEKGNLLSSVLRDERNWNRGVVVTKAHDESSGVSMEDLASLPRGVAAARCGSRHCGDVTLHLFGTSVLVIEWGDVLASIKSGKIMFETDRELGYVRVRLRSIWSMCWRCCCSLTCIGELQCRTGRSNERRHFKCRRCSFRVRIPHATRSDATPQADLGIRNFFFLGRGLLSYASQLNELYVFVKASISLVLRLAALILDTHARPAPQSRPLDLSSELRRLYLPPSRKPSFIRCCLPVLYFLIGHI